MSTVLTGMQPSGALHIGNYLGAMLPILKHIEKHEKSVLMIANLHTLTSLQNAKELKKNTLEMAAAFLALGIDPEKTLLFRQSEISAHSELSWILSTISPMGLLERAHAFKDKKANGIDATVGLFTYPILMAADILLYDTNVVPVGKDQKQHVEIARDLAQKFNHLFGETFVLPESDIAEETGIIPGLDGRKMSKSYGNTIPLFSTENELRKKIMQIQTDSLGVEEPKNPETCNVFALAKFFLSADELSDLEKKYKAGGMGYGTAKELLFEGMKKTLLPLQAKYAEFLKDEQKLIEILENSEETVRRIANRKMEKVRKKLGV